MLITKLSPSSKVPKQQTPGSAGYDLHSDEDVILYPAIFQNALLCLCLSLCICSHWFFLIPLVTYYVYPNKFLDNQKIIKTNIALAIPQGHVGIIKDRSSLAVKKVYTSAGVIDSDYRKGVGVVIRNESLFPFKISKGDRIAQLLIAAHNSFGLDEVDVLPETTRTDGYGSTGK